LWLEAHGCLLFGCRETELGMRLARARPARRRRARGPDQRRVVGARLEVAEVGHRGGSPERAAHHGPVVAALAQLRDIPGSTCYRAPLEPDAGPAVNGEVDAYGGAEAARGRGPAAAARGRGPAAAASWRGRRRRAAG